MFSSVSLSHAPLPDVPLSVRTDPIINKTLSEHPDLFSIVTPIHVDRFEALLVDHPNQPFVQSVTRGLREGFWPFADERPSGYPDTWDEVRPLLADEHARQFLREQRHEEIRLGRYSQSFGRDLLPGMYCMPVHVVPKPHSNKFRLINNQSAGHFSLNSLIRPEAIKGAVLDGIPALGHALRTMRSLHPDSPFLLWKSDVSQAYRRMPVSPYYQMGQAVTIDGEYYIDRCVVFGGRASLRIWAAFNSLVHWIAEEKCGISPLLNYVDDDFGVSLLTDVEWYAPDNRLLPRDQARLLSLWDELGVPHDEPKQIFGPSLPIIGFDVNTITMSASLPDDGIHALLDTVTSFCASRRRSLRDFQSLAGYLNWALNVFPFLRPGLSSLYAKIANKDKPYAAIYINQPIRSELSWLVGHLRTATGIHFLTAETWTPADLDEHDPQHEFAMVDASALGMGVYFPWRHIGYFCDLPANPPSDAIFFYEALSVCTALHRVPAWREAGRAIFRLAVLSDNSNAVSIFNSLKAEPAYNSILISAVDVILNTGVDLRVDHVPGELNVVADALSRRRFDLARSLDPSLTLLSLIPPQDALGAVSS